MRYEFVRWVNVLGTYVSRFGKLLFLRPKKEKKCRQLSYRRSRRFESLQPRRLLTAYVLDQSLASPVDLSGDVFLPPSGIGGDVAYVSSPTNKLVIQQTTVTPVTGAERVDIPAGMNITANEIDVQETTPLAMNIRVFANITASLISFDGNGPYTLTFSASNTIGGGAISVQSNLTVDVQQFVTGTIASSVSASNFRLTTADLGQLSLTGAVTVGSFVDNVANLALSGAVTITNGDSSGVGLAVIDSPVTGPIITGTGPLDLQSASSPFNYASTAGPPAGSTTSPEQLHRPDQRAGRGGDHWRRTVGNRQRGE